MMKKIDIPTDRLIYDGGRLIRISNYSQIYRSLDDFLSRHVRFRMWLTVLMDMNMTIITWKHTDDGVIRRIELGEVALLDNFEGYPVLTLGLGIVPLRRDNCFYTGNPDLIYMHLPGNKKNIYTCISNPKWSMLVGKKSMKYTLSYLKSINDELPPYFSGEGDIEFVFNR